MERNVQQKSFINPIELLDILKERELQKNYSHRERRKVYRKGRHTLKQPWYTQCISQSQVCTEESV